jgi:hypothetical protein
MLANIVIAPIFLFSDVRNLEACGLLNYEMSDPLAAHAHGMDFQGIFIMKTRDIHVFPHNKGWAVKKENTQRVSYVSASQEEAIDRARRQAKGQRV